MHNFDRDQIDEMFENCSVCLSVVLWITFMLQHQKIRGGCEVEYHWNTKISFWFWRMLSVWLHAEIGTFRGAAWWVSFSILLNAPLEDFFDDQRSAAGHWGYIDNVDEREVLQNGAVPGSLREAPKQNSFTQKLSTSDPLDNSWYVARFPCDAVLQGNRLRRSLEGNRGVGQEPLVCENVWCAKVRRETTAIYWRVDVFFSSFTFHITR